MGKYAMLNCWSDLNKGDLGIMLATIQEIHRQDENAEVIAISSFDQYDPMFKASHKILQTYVTDVLPAIFGVLGFRIGGNYRKEFLFKVLALLIENIHFAILMLLPKSIARLCLNKKRRDCLDRIVSCDVCFSKGGSIFTDYNNMRGSIALKRLCRMYILLHKFGCKYYILGQSFGPIQKGKGSNLVNKVIDNAESVYIRETECVKQYPWIHLNQEKIIFSNDAGFLLPLQPVDPNPVDTSVTNIGLTVRGVENGNDTYIDTMKKMICYLILEKKCIVHIFQQVAMENEPDNKAAEVIINNLPKEYQDKVIYHTKNYLPQELCWLYGEMDVFIGTRLHSTIFAMCAGTPSIGIVYHGTKTQGIFENIGVPELVIKEPIDFERLKDIFEYCYRERNKLKQVIKNGVARAQGEMRMAVGTIVKAVQSQQ